MTFLHTLRNTPSLTKLALLWFALTLGVAVAAPLVHPQQEQLICTSMGMLKVVFNDDGSYSAVGTSDGMVCPLCVVGGAPASVAVTTPHSPHRLGHVMQSIPVARLAALMGVQPPARGPPQLKLL
jgi:hypothetical protein